MKSRLKFVDHSSGQPSDCGQVLEIELSSQELNWQGVVLEKGTSPHFYPTHVSTPYFYFALGLEEELHWEAETAEGMAPLHTIPGEIWINPPDTPFTHKIDEPCYFVILAIEKDIFLNHCPLQTDGKEISFLKNYNVQDNVLKSIIDLFLIEVENKGQNGPEYLKNLISMLSVHYLNNYSDFNDQEKQLPPPSRFSEHDLARIDRLINERIDQQISIEEMAEALSCSKYYFLREFKKLTGETPYQHLLNIRLDRAKDALSNDKLNLQSIALDLGFSDQAHFTRAFKKKFGVTPGKYKTA